MNSAFTEKIIDLALDFMDFYENTKKRFSGPQKKQFQILASALILGISCGFAAATASPETPDSKLMLASVLYEQEMKASTKKEKPETVEETPMYTEEELQAIYSEVIVSQNPDLCSEKLLGQEALDCQDNYWEIQASFNNTPDACNNIQNKDKKSQCIANVNSGTGTITDEQIQSRAESCTSMTTEANQNVCWNSLYLSVAIAQADITRCEAIKNTQTQDLCKKQAQEKLDEKTYQEAVKTANPESCNTLPAQKQKSCLTEITNSLLTVSETCDKTCVSEKAKSMAVEQKNIALCSKVLDKQGQSDCRDNVYTAFAVEAKDSTYCQKVVDPNTLTSCKSSVAEEEDKNPLVQSEVYQKSDRSFPSIGESILSPLEDSSLFYGSLGDVKTDSSSNQVSSTIHTEVCDFYQDEKQKTACIDSLVLQVAIPNKNVSQCARIQDSSTREYCELSIVQADAIKAAEEAKRKCLQLSSSTAQDKCLRSSGFLDAGKSNNSDCLDYSNPEDRIACMKKESGPSSVSTPIIKTPTKTKEEESLGVVNSLDELEAIIQNSLKN